MASSLTGVRVAFLGEGLEVHPGNRALLLPPSQALGRCHACKHHRVTCNPREPSLRRLHYVTSFQICPWLCSLSKVKEAVLGSENLEQSAGTSLVQDPYLPNSSDGLYETKLFVLMEEVTRRYRKMGSKPNGLYF